MKPLVKIIILALFTIGQVKALFAQDNFKNDQIKWSPVRMGDIINPGLELGYERFYSGGNLSTQISYGYMRDLVKVTPYNDYKGSRFSLEEKYFHKRGRRIGFYFAFEVVRLDVNYGTSATYFRDTTKTYPTYTDEYTISKQTLTFNTKYGLQIATPVKNLMLDITAGVGVKYRKVVWSGIDNKNAVRSKSRHPNIYEESDREGDGWVPNLPINLKLCYQF